MRFAKRYSFIEVLIAFAVILICVRYIWAKELLAIENRTLTNLGLPIYSKYFITVPLGALFIYGIYKRESDQAKHKEIPVVRKAVFITAIALLSIAILFFIFAIGGNA